MPTYNEAQGLEKSLAGLLRMRERLSMPSEILVVDDGSTDNTPEILRRHSAVMVVRHPENRGYGAALKTGIRAARGDLLGIIDSDGTYPVDDFPRLLETLTDGVEMVVGVRVGNVAAFPLLRRPGKVIVSALAAFLVGRRIPDLNSGMRVMRREFVERFFHLFPDGFSFTTTATLAALTNKLGVRWVPVVYAPRVGKSTITLRRGLFQEFPNFLTLIVRIVTYFRPLRFFAVPSLLFLGLGIANMARTLTLERNISDASIVLVVVGIQIGLMGLIADLIVRSRG
ncbi:MAG: glycosyl transferase group 2 family protein [Parcubacteria group bacterium Gr01-1014_38]|nr:MAG: glycosyl transferase group 2 family protein [Parcubacteria group bacterium Gr01-1014_38]